MTGAILIVIGLAFLLKNLGVISSSVWGFIWPVLLIVLGIWFLWRDRGGGIFLEEHLGWRSRKGRERSSDDDVLRTLL